MSEEFSFTGYWWLPDKITERWLGTVSFGPEEGINLELMSDPSQNHKLPNLGVSAQTIHGLVKDDPCKVTLLGCYSSGRWSHSPNDDVNTRNYRANLLLRGVWQNPSEEITFRSVGVVFTSLDGWMQTSDPAKSVVPFMVEAEENQHKAIYQRRPPVEIAIPDKGMRLSFYAGISEFIGTHRLEWQQSSSMTIIPDSPKSLEWLLKQVFHTRDLLAFLTGLPVELKRAVASKETSETTNSNVEFHPQVYIYFPTKEQVIDSDSEITMPFPLDVLGGSAQEVFQNWFKTDSKYRTVIELCLTIIYSRIRLNRFEFLALMQALESYHRAKHGDENMSLKRRLKKLHGDLPPQVRYVAYSDDYIKSLVDTRTCFTHDIEKKCKRALQGDNLYDANTRLIPFIATMLYRELGLKDEMIVKAYNKVQYYGLWGRAPLMR